MKVHPPYIPAALFWYMMSNHTWGAASREEMLKATCVALTKSLQICLASMLQGRRFWEMYGKSEQGVAKIAPKRALLQQCDVSPWYIHSYLIWIVSHSALFRSPGIHEIDTFWHEVSTNYMAYGYSDYGGSQVDVIVAHNWRDSRSPISSFHPPKKPWHMESIHWKLRTMMLVGKPLGLLFFMAECQSAHGFLRLCHLQKLRSTEIRPLTIEWGETDRLGPSNKWHEPACNWVWSLRVRARKLRA